MVKKLIGMNYFEVCYSNNLQSLTIADISRNVSAVKEGKYGIEVGYNVFGAPVSFTIPNPEVVIGIPISDFLKMNCVTNN